MNPTASTIAPSTTADPRSPWRRHAPAPNPAMSISGNSVRRGSAICSWRVARMLAASASVASFSTSDGWKLSEPTVTHARGTVDRGAQPAT